MRKMLVILLLVGMVVPAQAQLFGNDKEEIERETSEKQSFKDLFSSSKKEKSQGVSERSVQKKSQTGLTQSSRKSSVNKKSKTLKSSSKRLSRYSIDGASENEVMEPMRPSDFLMFGDTIKMNHRRSVLTFDTPDTTLDRHYNFKGLVLGGALDATAISDSTLPNGFRQVMTNLDFYDQGEDLQMIDEDGHLVTLSFDKNDSTRLSAVSVEDIRDLNYARRLQTQVRQQMGTPMMGYEVVKNYDSEGTGMKDDYSTYEFVYRYRYVGMTYDFRLQQKGMKTQGKRVLRPYDFTVTILETPLTFNQPKTIDADAPQVEEAAEVERFYPKEGMREEGNFMVETKILNRW